jgi:hypothetical protein
MNLLLSVTPDTLLGGKQEWALDFTRDGMLKIKDLPEQATLGQLALALSIMEVDEKKTLVRAPEFTNLSPDTIRLTTASFGTALRTFAENTKKPTTVVPDTKDTWSKMAVRWPALDDLYKKVQDAKTRKTSLERERDVAEVALRQKTEERLAYEASRWATVLDRIEKGIEGVRLYVVDATERKDFSSQLFGIPVERRMILSPFNEPFAFSKRLVLAILPEGQTASVGRAKDIMNMMFERKDFGGSRSEFDAKVTVIQNVNQFPFGKQYGYFMFPMDLYQDENNAYAIAESKRKAVDEAKSLLDEAVDKITFVERTLQRKLVALAAEREPGSAKLGGTHDPVANRVASYVRGGGKGGAGSTIPSWLAVWLDAKKRQSNQ